MGALEFVVLTGLTSWVTLGFGVPCFNTLILKGTIIKQKFILFSPWLLKSPLLGSSFSLGLWGGGVDGMPFSKLLQQRFRVSGLEFRAWW